MSNVTHARMFYSEFLLYVHEVHNYMTDIIFIYNIYYLFDIIYYNVCGIEKRMSFFQNLRNKQSRQLESGDDEKW